LGTGRKDRSTDPPPAGAFNNPFGALAPLRSTLPDQPAPAPPKAGPRPPARAVIRLERKGHGGKEVTLVTHLGLSPLELEKWAKALKSELGVGGGAEGDALVLQGDQRDRLKAALAARGITRITVG
jgi:translation initiation factor 1